MTIVASTTTPTEGKAEDQPGNFVEDIVKADLAAGKNDGRLMSRFPPEPNDLYREKCPMRPNSIRILS